MPRIHATGAWFHLALALTTIAVQPKGNAMEIVTPAPTTFRGVWYGCGTENTLPGRDLVYAGGKATYCAWHRPMAVYAPAVNKTFFVFGDAENRPAISYFDHQTSTFAPPLALGTNPDGNAHRNPTLCIDEDGFLYVFYGYAGGKQPIPVLRSIAPFDITRWERRADLTDGSGSYPNPWQLRSREILVTHRVPAGWAFRRTREGGATWEPTVSLVEFGSYEGTSTAYGFSMAETGPYPRKLHFVWSRLGGGSPEAVRTKHLWARRFNVYYACSDDGGDTWRRSDGTAYTLPITEDIAEKLYDSGEHGIWLKDMQIDNAGNPIILFIDANTDTYESAWKVARHADGLWTLADVTRTDHMYDGGALVVLADDDIRLYGPTAASQPRVDGGEIEEWQSTDHGRAWTRRRALTNASPFAHNHVKTVFDQDASDGRFRVFWSYGDGRVPPESRDVRLFCFGDGMDTPREIP
ncbi:MAG TPA: BNR-4 repeat-containing protein [Candidatus Hydrogenedentes bacterium]|nr:BNR-4 repeat-containing protein [Candidatus Hydrogenedentota bacterium]HPG68378.1 BNR-4 repeat-containing protein [Candidatus Hydrogenedentota bacterium]